MSVCVRQSETQRVKPLPLTAVAPTPLWLLLCLRFHQFSIVSQETESVNIASALVLCALTPVVCPQVTSVVLVLHSELGNWLPYWSSPRERALSDGSVCAAAGPPCSHTGDWESHDSYIRLWVTRSGAKDLVVLRLSGKGFVVV